MASVCRSSGLVKYTELQARLEAAGARLRANSPDDPRTEASYKKCRGCKGWHLHIPEERANPIGKKPER